VTIPSVWWLDKECNPDLSEACVTIGSYKEDRRATLGSCVTNTDGFEYAFVEGKEEGSRFIGKTLDYRDGRFTSISRAKYELAFQLPPPEETIGIALALIALIVQSYSLGRDF
jgi:hypothetical protein